MSAHEETLQDRLSRLLERDERGASYVDHGDRKAVLDALERIESLERERDEARGLLSECLPLLPYQPNAGKMRPSAAANFVARIRAFRRELMAEIEKEKGADIVYQLNLQLFPLSQPREDADA